MILSNVQSTRHSIWHSSSDKSCKMIKDKNIRSKQYGDEAPRLKDFLIVLFIVAALIAFSWIAYYKFGWFH